MESLTEKVKAFLSVVSGSDSGCGSGWGSGCGYGYGCDSSSGSGSGRGDGSGCGSGWGSGCGYGYGYGLGDGSGSGSGYGYGSDSGSDEGVKNINGENVYKVDNVQTIIRAVHGNVARGAILNSDLTLMPCYIAKQDDKFAHGETLREAMSALRDKLFKDMPEEERIDAFLEEHKPGVEYPCRDLYEWHHRLTGSCEMGRKQFAKDHGIDIDKDKMTVERFIELTRNAYGGEIIRKVEERIKEES